MARDGMVNHLKRAEPYGKTRPWHTSPEMSAGLIRNHKVEVSVGTEVFHSFCKTAGNKG